MKCAKPQFDNPHCYAPWITERSLCVHDEILLEVPIEAEDEVALILKETMEELEGLF